MAKGRTSRVCVQVLVALLHSSRALRTRLLPTFTVPLSKQLVPVQVNGRTVSHKAAYFGTIYAGRVYPQAFTVVFDTGSGHLFLPSDACTDESCLVHRRFLRNASSTNVSRDQVSIAYGTGEVLGDYIHEMVCLGHPANISGLDVDASNASSDANMTSASLLPYHCTEARVVLARRMTAEPFRAFEFDGVLGLGLDALALHPEFHLFSTMTRGGLTPVFSVFLSHNAGVKSEITFGGHDEARMAGPLRWAPVVQPELGYWRVRIRSISVGGKSVPFCKTGDCFAVLDTGTSMLGVPRGALRSILGLTARPVSDPVPEDCRTVPGPPIVFELEDLSVIVDSSDYFRPAVTRIPAKAGRSNPQTVCRASLLPVELPALGPKAFLFGEPVLRKYYTSYDAKALRVGFALAAQTLTSDDRAVAPTSSATAVGAPATMAANGAGGSTEVGGEGLNGTPFPSEASASITI